MNETGIAKSSAEHAGKQPSSPAARGRLAGLLLLVGALAFAFGWPGRDGDFMLGDDETFVLEHVYVNNPSLTHAWKLVTMVHNDLYQPLPMLSFMINFALAGPDESGRSAVSPFAFHLTNILLHVLNAGLVFMIAWRISRRRLIAFLTGAMFACHPFAQEPVAWITGRMVLLATTFSLLTIALCLYRRSDGRGPWPWTAGIAWLAALLSKVMPSVPVAAAWCDQQSRRSWPRRCWFVYGVLLLLAVAGTAIAVASTSEIGFFEKMEAESTTSIPVRILLASRYYFENYFWPSRLCAWSPPPENVPFASWAAGIGILEWCAFFALAILAWRHSRVCFIGLVLFAILIAPFLGVTAARRFLTADRYMYLPILGLHLAAAGAFAHLWNWARRRASTGVAAAALGGPAVAVLTIWMSIGWQQADVWSSMVNQAQRTIEIYPNDINVRIELAKAYVGSDEPDRALAILDNTRRRWPDNPRIPTHAGEAYRQKKDWVSAERELKVGLQLRPHHGRTRYHYALTLEKLNRPAEARREYLQILNEYEGYLPAITALARNCREAGKIEEAIHWFERAIEINRYHRHSLYELALLRIRRGEWNGAESLLRSIVDFSMDDAQAEFHLGVCLFNTGRSAEALDIYDKLLRTDLDNSLIRVNRAYALSAVSRPDEAEAEFRDILAASPDSFEAAVGLHELLQQQGRYENLSPLWQAFRQREDAPAESAAYLAWALALDGDRAGATAAMEGTPRASDSRGFAEWALVYDALRRGSDADLQNILSIAPDRWPPAPRREHGRVIITALADLPEQIRSTTAARYALAAALLQTGDWTNACRVAKTLATGEEADRWTKGSEEILKLIDPEANQAAPGSDGSTRD